ncbi:MAG: GNAT family N-acetyltransferase [Bryobacteraceae bacterium]
MISIREETPHDLEAIREINRLAFLGDAEARLVERLRSEGLALVSLVALDGGCAAGHILFSRLRIDTANGELRAAALAPMAVRPELQRRGIGSHLVERGLALCRERGETIIIVVGHPGYYPRFGFSPGLARGLDCVYSGPAFMALELAPGALGDGRGTVRYPDAFEAFE